VLDPTQQEKINQLLRSLEVNDPIIYELGTPQLAETDEVSELVSFGHQIVPYLLELTETETPRVVAYIVLTLGKLGDVRAIDRLRSLRAEYQMIEPKTEWHYAAIGQCNVVIEALEQATEQREP